MMRKDSVILSAAKNLASFPGPRSFAALRMTETALRMTAIALRMTETDTRFFPSSLSLTSPNPPRLTGLAR